MLEAEPLADSGERPGTIAGTVVGHDALDLHAQARVVGDSAFEEGPSTGFPLVLLDLGEGDARGVVDADRNELPADAAGLALADTIPR